MTPELSFLKCIFIVVVRSLPHDYISTGIREFRLYLVVELHRAEMQIHSTALRKILKHPIHRLTSHAIATVHIEGDLYAFFAFL